MRLPNVMRNSYEVYRHQYFAEVKHQTSKLFDQPNARIIITMLGCLAALAQKATLIGMPF
jgi:hypothetical protein